MIYHQAIATQWQTHHVINFSNRTRNNLVMFQQTTIFPKAHQLLRLLLLLNNNKNLKRDLRKNTTIQAVQLKLIKLLLQVIIIIIQQILQANIWWLIMVTLELKIWANNNQVTVFMSSSNSNNSLKYHLKCTISICRLVTTEWAMAHLNSNTLQPYLSLTQWVSRLTQKMHLLDQ